MVDRFSFACNLYSLLLFPYSHTHILHDFSFTMDDLQMRKLLSWDVARVPINRTAEGMNLTR
jgi:hypothetical protein